jgi:succinate--hydroxymethylglutarate CoA-transferase
MLLADMGADVIKVEEVTRGDDTREWPVLAYPLFVSKKTGSWLPPSAPVSPNSPKESSHLPPESAYFLAVNRNKRSITVNFKDPAGLEVIQRLVRSSDVLVENFIAGKLAGMGLGWEDCKVLNPRLVYASITGLSELYFPYLNQFMQLGYGQTGPFREAAGYDVIIEAEAGLMHMYVYCVAGASK